MPSANIGLPVRANERPALAKLESPNVPGSGFGVRQHQGIAFMVRPEYQSVQFLRGHGIGISLTLVEDKSLAGDTANTMLLPSGRRSAAACPWFLSGCLRCASARVNARELAFYDLTPGAFRESQKPTPGASVLSANRCFATTEDLKLSVGVPAVSEIGSYAGVGPYQSECCQRLQAKTVGAQNYELHVGCVGGTPGAPVCPNPRWRCVAETEDLKILG